jgi:hypothetical protein
MSDVNPQPVAEPAGFSDPAATKALWPERFVIEGRQDGKPVTLELDGERIGCTMGESAAQHPLDAISELRVIGSSAKTVLLLVAAISAALGTLWLVQGTVGGSAPTIALAVAVLAWALGCWWPRCELTVRAGDDSLRLACRGQAARAAREAAVFLRFRVPGLRPRSRSILGFLSGELAALFAGRAALRWEYRSIAGAGAEPETEARFVGARRKVAAWNLGWTVAAPALLAALQHFAFEPSSASWAVARVALTLVVGGVAGLRLLPRMQPMLKRWIG